MLLLKIIHHYYDHYNVVTRWAENRRWARRVKERYLTLNIHRWSALEHIIHLNCSLGSSPLICLCSLCECMRWVKCRISPQAWITYLKSHDFPQHDGVWLLVHVLIHTSNIRCLVLTRLIGNPSLVYSVLIGGLETSEGTCWMQVWDRKQEGR